MSENHLVHPDGALIVNKIHPEALPPRRSSSGAVGYDIFSIEDAIVPANGKTIVKTGIRLCIPSGHYGRIAPRSGLAANHSIDVGAGVVDPDYRGEILVVLFNHSSKEVSLPKHSRIAQLILERCSVLPVNIASNEIFDLDMTERGAGRFGSTGI
jgi:dUTP pyrophosphatase